MVTTSVSHIEQMKKSRYVVWSEDGRNDLEVDGNHSEKAYRLVVDLYTKSEFDSWAGEIEEAFEVYGLPYRLNDFLFEEETGFFHTQWVVTVYE